MRFLLAALLAAGPAWGQEGDRKGLQRAGEIAAQPLEDVNIIRDRIPPELAAIGDAPYGVRPRGCGGIAAAIAPLDRVLGADVDDPSSDGELGGAAKTALTAAKLGVNSLIPGRGVVRELTGANKAQREYQNAIQAGVIRRAYLKGLGAARGCKPPAAPR